MIIATDPIVSITVPASVDLTAKVGIWVTFKQQTKPLDPNPFEVVITKSTWNQDEIDIISPTLMHVYLTQADTMQFCPGKHVGIQVNWLNADETREATKPAFLMVGENFLPQILQSIK